MNMLTERRGLLYILAPSYTGSTLLTFLLAKQKEIATVGELKATARGDLSTYPCSCGALQRECVFWKKVTEEMQKAGTSFTLEDFGTHFRSDSFLSNRLLRAGIRGPLFETARGLLLQLLPACRRRLHEIVERNRQMIDLICALQGGRVFLDGSKDPNRLQFLVSAGHWNVKVIYLIRDGRGATNSYMRHHNVPMETAAREWLRTHQECDRMVRKLGGNTCLTIYYEDLCRDPAGTRARTDTFLGLNMDLNDESASHHILGNQMRLTSLAEIRLDDKWKSTLAPEDREAFERIGGRLNRRYGYHSAD